MKSHQTHWVTKRSFFTCLETKNDISESQASAECASVEKIWALEMRFQKNSIKKHEKMRSHQTHWLTKRSFFACLETKMIETRRERRMRKRRKILGFGDAISKKFHKKHEKMKSHQTIQTNQKNHSTTSMFPIEIKILRNQHTCQILSKTKTTPRSPPEQILEVLKESHCLAIQNCEAESTFRGPAAPPTPQLLD